MFVMIFKARHKLTVVEPSHFLFGLGTWEECNSPPEDAPARLPSGPQILHLPLSNSTLLWVGREPSLPQRLQVWLGWCNCQFIIFCFFINIQLCLFVYVTVHRDREQFAFLHVLMFFSVSWTSLLLKSAFCESESSGASTHLYLESLTWWLTLSIICTYF